jgi:hypothetical protein
MKQYSKYTKYVVMSLFATLFLVSCMDSEEINTPKYLPKTLSVGAYFIQMQNTVYPAHVNDYQIDQNFIGDVYGRYICTNMSWGGGRFELFNVRDAWIGSPFAKMSDFYPAWLEVKLKTDGEGVNFAWAQLLRVAMMQRLTDMYGPLPYSQITGQSIVVPYDSQEEVYNHLFDDIDFAIDELTAYALAFPNDRSMEPYDNVYSGNFSQWVKYANSLKLRLAMRIVYANPTLAKQKAEEAVNHPIGVILTNNDNAGLKYVNGHPINNMVVGWEGQAIACADLVSYMKGYNDPRIDDYFNKYNNDFVGVRVGIDFTNDIKDCSTPKFENDDRVLWLNAAEVSFLRAEGVLRGWNMGGGTVEDFYNEGVALSFNEHSVGGVDAYLADNTSRPANCSYPGYLNPAISTITIKWDNSATEEVKLERLITQKWIALYPLGSEAWSDYRRTGYPRFFPIVVNKGTAGNDGSLTTVAKRIPFAPNEKINNAANYAGAVSLLGGVDAYSTKVWWDKK